MANDTTKLLKKYSDLKPGTLLFCDCGAPGGLLGSDYNHLQLIIANDGKILRSLRTGFKPGFVMLPVMHITTPFHYNQSIGSYITIVRTSE